MDPDEVRARLEREVREWTERHTNTTVTEEEVVAAVGDAFLRAGVPVTNGRLEGAAVVFDRVFPDGQG